MTKFKQSKSQISLLALIGSAFLGVVAGASTPLSFGTATGPEFRLVSSKKELLQRAANCLDSQTGKSLCAQVRVKDSEGREYVQAVRLPAQNIQEAKR